MTYGIKTLYRIALLASGMLIGGCSIEQPSISNDFEIRISGKIPETKVSMLEGDTEISFSWQASDRIGLFVSDIQQNQRLECTDPSAGTFRGNLPRCERACTQALFSAYYPYSAAAGEDATALKGTLPSVQNAADVMAYDYIVATPVVADYDEANFPELNFAFDTHLFALTKLSITANSAIYNGEEIFSISLKSTQDVMSGDFTFNATDPDADIVFSSSTLKTHKEVRVNFAEGSRPGISQGTKYSVHAMVNPGMYRAGTLSLEVVTTNYVITLPIKANLPILKNVETILPTGNICSSSAIVERRTKEKRTIVLWGDSITAPGTFSSELQRLLGDSWIVVNRGVPSDAPFQVAGRQGGYPLYTDETDFILSKNSADTTVIGGIWVKHTRNEAECHKNLLYWRTHGYKTNCGISPATLTGYYTDTYGVEHEETVSCDIDFIPDTPATHSPGICVIKRVSNGEHDLVIKGRTRVYTYASEQYRQADVIAVYVGTNGAQKTTEYYNHLIDAQDCMLAHLDNPTAIMLVCGYQMSSAKYSNYWTQTYSDMMKEHFGEYFIDQKVEGAEKAVEYMIALGQITDASQISAQDRACIEGKNWPDSWGGSEVHPNTYGYKVRAMLIYDKMVELGLVY